MKRKKILLCLIIFFMIILSACSKNNGKKIEFKANESEYSFQFLKGWSQLDDKSKKSLNEEALFQGEDDNTNAVMFIRSQPSKLLNAKELEEKVDKQLTSIYQLDSAEKKKFKVNNYEAINYRIPSVYEEKAVWLDMYFISTETNVINFQYYFPKNNGISKLEEKALASVKTLNLEKKGKLLEESEPREVKGIQQVEQDKVFLQVTGNKVDETRLILRYVVTNKSNHKAVPLELWKELVTITSEDKVLEIDNEKTNDTELNYLLEKSQQEVKPGSSVECAIVYELPEMKNTITVQLETDAGPLITTIER